MTSLFVPRASCSWVGLPALHLLFGNQVVLLEIILDGQVPRPLALLLCQLLIDGPHGWLGLGALCVSHSLLEVPAMCLLGFAPFDLRHIRDLADAGLTGLLVVAEDDIPHLAAEAP